MAAFKFSPLLFLSLFLLSCARQELPSGGPEDRVPPQILDHLPSSLATGVSPQTKLKIFFSEPMDRKTVEESIFISPPLPFEAEWKGRFLTLTPTAPLSPSCTWVVTLGTGCRDLHGNPLPQAYTFAFSTGESIDQGSIEGKVFFQGEPIEGASIWAYHSPPNTPRLEHTPDYITQSGVGGAFHFDYLSLGNYLIFALLDKNRDGRWGPASEPLAIPAGEITLSAARNSVGGCYLSLALRDTTRPNLISLQQIDEEKLKLVFDRSMDSLQIFDPTNFSLRYEKGTLPLKGIWPEYRRLDRIYLWTERQVGGREYTLRMKEIGDRWGNLLAPQAGEVRFVGSSLPDTLPPHLLGLCPPNGANSVSLDIHVELFFSEPMDQPSVMGGFSLLNAEGDTVLGNFNWPFPNLCQYIPEKPLPGSATYTVRLEGGKVVDLRGNRLSDSTLTSRFSTLNPDTLGSLSGRVTLSDTTQEGWIFLSCNGVKGRTSYVRKIGKPGPYTLEGLICGRYILKAWLDRNLNNRWDRGMIFPFSLAEPFTVYPDTVRIRARWETEGVEMVIGLEGEP